MASGRKLFENGQAGYGLCILNIVGYGNGVRCVVSCEYDFTCQVDLKLQDICPKISLIGRQQTKSNNLADLDIGYPV